MSRQKNDQKYVILNLESTMVSLCVYKLRVKIVLNMKTFTAIIEKDRETGLYVGYIPGFPGAHSQGETLGELQQNLSEVIEMLLEDTEPILEAEFVGTQQIILQSA